MAAYVVSLVITPVFKKEMPVIAAFLRRWGLHVTNFTWVKRTANFKGEFSTPEQPDGHKATIRDWIDGKTTTIQWRLLEAHEDDLAHEDEPR